MFASAMLSVALGQVVASPRVRVVLPNRSRGFVERVVGSGQVAVCLAFGAGPVADTEATHGARHLVEHLIARLPDVDRALESRGIVLLAETTRDATFYDLRGPKAELATMLDALRRVVRPIRPTAADIAREARVIGEEKALLDPTVRLSSLAWDGAFGSLGRDPFGREDSIAALTPETVAALAARTHVAGNAALSVVGDIDPQATATRVEEWLESLPPGPGGLPVRPRDAANPAGGMVAPVTGAPHATPTGPVSLAARFLAVGGTDDRATLALLTVGFAAAAANRGAALAFTPSPVSSVVTVVGLSGDRGLDLTRGRVELQAWLTEQSRAVASRARWRALWELAGRALDLDGLPGLVAGLTPTELEAAMAAWGWAP